MDRKIFVLSAMFFCAFAFFTYGFLVGAHKFPPFATISSVESVVTSLWQFGGIVPEGRRFPAPDDAVRKRFHIHRPDKMQGGYYIIMGWDTENLTYAAWLIDDEGKQLHAWTIDYESFVSEEPAYLSDNPHGLQVLPDGTLMVLFDHGNLLTRIDGCSKPIWIRRDIFHHSLELAEDGGVWTWRSEGSAYAHYNWLDKIDPETGESIFTIDFIEDILKRSGIASRAFGVKPDFAFVRTPGTLGTQNALDLFHPNDVEELPQAMADAFPLFEAGDLLISVRNLHLLAVVEPKTGEMKWWRNGPWRFQHDPDFLPNGLISVFNNNRGMRESEILTIDPYTGKLDSPFSDGELTFHSAHRGKHQYLPNGNVLIVIPEEGRVLEVTSAGDKVMEFNNLSTFRPDHNEDIENGNWLAQNYFETLPQCL